MKLRKAVLIVPFAVGYSILMLGTPVSAEQGAAKEAEGSHGAHSDMDCCQKRGEQGKGKSCCANHEASHGSLAAADCCQKKGEHEEGKSCCANHEGSHGAGPEGSHGGEGSH